MNEYTHNTYMDTTLNFLVLIKIEALIKKNKYYEADIDPYPCVS